MKFKKTILTLTLISFATLPAWAAKKQTFTCESSVDANGNTIYLPVKPAKHAARHKAKRHHVAKARAPRVYREETKTVAAAPVVVETRPVLEQRTAADKREAWWRKHMVTEPIYGNMSGWAGRSTISYLHGTDNPFGKLALNSDVGPSAMKYRNTATEDQNTGF